MKSLAEGLEEFYSQQAVAPRRGRAGSSLVGFKRLDSLSLKVHPKQAQEAMEDAAKKGVPTEFTRSGRPRFTSRAHRKAYCKAYGHFDKDAGYGDQAPTHSTQLEVDPGLIEAVRELFGSRA